MENSNMKNMVILKNLPSNLVEEAIVVLKSNKKARKLEKIDKTKIIEGGEKNNKGENYIIKEAEMLINDYILQIEDEEKRESKDNSKKNKKLKKYNFIISIIAIVEFIGLLVS